MTTKYDSSFIVFPKHCNHMQNIIFGGHFMAEMDLAAAHCVRRALFDSECSEAVTHKVLDLTFHKPCYLGDLIELKAKIISAKVKSIVVSVHAYKNTKGVLDSVADAKFVFVSIETKDLNLKREKLPYKNHNLQLDIDEPICKGED